MNMEVFIATREAERCLLGAILIQHALSTTYLGLPSAIESVRNIINPDDIYDQQNRRILTAMFNCQKPHQINVAQELHRTDKLQRGDCTHMSHCIIECPCSLDYDSYAQAVKNYSNMRKGIELKKKPVIIGGIN